MSKKDETSSTPCDMTIAVLGMGHVGLPTGAAFCELGWRVIGADSDPNKIEMIRAGHPPFHEPGLEELLRKQLATGRFELTTKVEDAIRAATVVFICVGTPQAEDGSADLRLVEGLARTIAMNLNSYKLIVEKSTVPAITGQRIKKTIERELAAGLLRLKKSNGNGNGDRHPEEEDAELPEFEVASNPEFLQEGRAIENLFKPDRIVCGVVSERAKQLLQRLYEPLGCPILFTDVNTAELIKHTANAFLATKISFINFVSDLCEAVGADIMQVANGIGLDQRIGRGFLDAGIGFGGYCLPKDLRALAHLAEEHNVNASLLREVETINRNRVEMLVQKISKALWILPGKTIAILGLAFKAGTDDVRESPSLYVVKALASRGVSLRLFDPQAKETAREVVPEIAGRITYYDDPYAAAEDADALVVLTDWKDFRDLDLDRMRTLLKVPILVDARNLFSADIARRHGFEYVGIGRRSDRRSRQRDKRQVAELHRQGAEAGAVAAAAASTSATATDEAA